MLFAFCLCSTISTQFVASSLFCIRLTRVSSKQTKINFGSNRNKPKQDLFRVCFCLFRETKKNFCLFRCFELISKQPKQTDLFRNKPKQTETTLNFLKNSQIYSLLNCLGGSSLCFGSIETLCFGIEAKQQKQTVSKQAEKTKKTKKKRKTLHFRIVPKLVLVP
jgi:hypothetical protein